VKVLLFNGSVCSKGTSFSFARTTKQLAEEKGQDVEILSVMDYYRDAADLESLKRKLGQANIVGLITPLYVDSLPYPVIRFLEILNSTCRRELEGKSFFAVSQCGFPDLRLFGPLLESCRIFAESSGLRWLGGLGYGGGAIIDGAFLENLGGRGAKITSGFKMAVEDILKNQKIRPVAQKEIAFSVPHLAFWPLCVYLNYSSRKKAKQMGVTNLERKFYLE
jgi:hypothetical protein